jgi:spore coat protein CotH
VLEKNLDTDVCFLNLLTMLVSTVWCQLGKIAGPSGTVQKDLQSAKATIDVLLSLKDKTKGNLTKKEESMMSAAIADLQLNYSEEVSKSCVSANVKIQETDRPDLQK